MFIVAKIIDHGRKLLLGNGYSIHVGLLRPKSRGSVSLASADPLAMPMIDTNFLAERDDVDRLIQGFKLARKIMRQPALTRFGGKESRNSAQAQSDAQIEAFVRAHADCAYHPVGTCRMGAAPGRGGRSTACEGSGRAARSGRIDHAEHRIRQYQRAHHHDRGKGR